MSANSEPDETDPFLAAMERSPSPDLPRTISSSNASALGKRSRPNDGEDTPEGDNDNTPPADLEVPTASSASTPAQSGSQNLVISARRYAERKKLRAEQVAEIESFSQAPAHDQLCKIFVNQFVLHNKIDKIVFNLPPFQVNKDLEKNINEYAIAVLLSAKLKAYKGDVPRNHVLNILKKYRPGLPHNIERVRSDWDKVKAAASTALTEIRAQWKKNLRISVRGADEAHMNIYELASTFVRGTDWKVTVPLACRVALMRHHFCSLKDQKSGEFWDDIDIRLDVIRKASKGDAGRVARAFLKYLEEDRAKHGHDSDDLKDADDVVDDFQLDIDEIIDSNSVQAAS